MKYTPQYHQFEVSDQMVRDGFLALSGAAIMGYVKRLFHKKDSQDDRISKLEIKLTKLFEIVVSLKENRDSDLKKIDDLDNDIGELKKYMHKSNHKIYNLINEKTLKDFVIDSMDKDIKRIMAILSEKK